MYGHRWRVLIHSILSVRHLLRFAYAHVQLVLYRPFLHYISPRHCHGTKVDELSYACAAAAVSVSRNIVHIGLEIRKQRVLSGPYWFMMYTEFFAVLSLVFYAIENPDKIGSHEVLMDAHAGRQMIADLADKSLSADKVTKALKVGEETFWIAMIPRMDRPPKSPRTTTDKVLYCRHSLTNYPKGWNRRARCDPRPAHGSGPRQD